MTGSEPLEMEFDVGEQEAPAGGQRGLAGLPGVADRLAAMSVRPSRSSTGLVAPGRRALHGDAGGEQPALADAVPAARLPPAVHQFIGFYFIGMFFNLLLPTSVGGDVVRAWYLDAARAGAPRRFVSVLLDRGSGLLRAAAAGLPGGARRAAADLPGWIAGGRLGPDRGRGG